MKYVDLLKLKIKTEKTDCGTENDKCFKCEDI